MSAPPPPPPHGEMPRSGGLPPGKYDIFVIPEHSAGSGFLYLPSLQPSINSFVAGFASALILVVVCQSMAPAFRAWWDSFEGLGNMGITLLIVGVGFGAWALGRTQNDSGSSPGSKPKSSSPPPHNSGPSAGPPPGGYASTPPPNGTPPQPPPQPPPQSPPQPPPQPGPPPPPPPHAGTERTQSSWQKPPPQTGNKRPDNPKPSAKGSWEKARDEMRKKEEERKAKEAEQKRREDLAKRLAELRAKEAKERVEREKEKQRKDKEIADRKEKEAKVAEAKAAAAKAAETKAAGAKAAAEKAKAAAPPPPPSQAPTQTTQMPSPAAARGGSSYAFSGVGEKMSMWPNGKPPAPPSSTTAKAPPASPQKPPPAPTARTYVSTDEDAFSYRPYDKARRPQRRNSGGSMASDGSWAPSHTTARTSPPPSMRGPYTTKDPDKIVIQAVYLFMNQYAKTPASQLISGVGSVTDGLILRITTEGLFIDDDVRGVPQREWDVKAWTLKLVEVWCPPHCLNYASSASSPNPNNKSANLLYKMATGRARAGDRDPNKPFVGEDADAYLTDMLKACKDCCRLGLCEQKFGKTNNSANGQSGEWKARGLHLLRATVRDQDGKRYLFVIDESENWKVGASLQRLRRGAQARQLGVCSMTASESKNILETLGWTT